MARHRRIHSGKRPYKCPFADCQKTFTRRTTLTRHQNHHTGTVEEAAAATAAALASRPPGIHPRQETESGNYSDTASMASCTTGRTPSPGERHLPLSPTIDVPMPPLLGRQSGNMSYACNDSYPLPSHLRAGLQQPSPRSSPSASSPTLSAFGGSSFNSRPCITSHPTLPVLEPPTYHDLRQTGPGTGSNSPRSPHYSGLGWQSPVAGGLPSPGHSDSSFVLYPDPPYQPSQQLYYQNSHLRRPNSTEPDQYELSRPRIPINGEVWMT